MIGLRIKEERERLGLTQQELADSIAVAKRTLIDWEKNRTSPTAVQLSALSSIGMDVLYVIIGQHMINDNNQPIIPDYKISPEKQAFLDAFDGMTPEQRRAILEVGRVLSQSKSKRRAG